MGRRTTSIHGQEALSLNGLPEIGYVYSVDRAKKAASSRKKRKGDLGLNRRTTGFLKRVGGLWIPRSAGEISYVVTSPEALRDMDAKQAKERVREKYEESSTVSRKQIALWGSFSAGIVRKSALDKFKSYEVDSNSQLFNLTDIFEKDLSRKIYDGEMVRGSELTLTGIAEYLMSLRSFVGANLDDITDKRYWIQNRWVNKKSEAIEQEQDYIITLPNNELESLYEEAYYNFASRKHYWANVQKRIKEQKMTVSRSEPPYLQIPIEAY